MIIDISSIVGTDVLRKSIEGEITFENPSLFDDVTLISPVKVKGEVKNFSGEIEFSLNLIGEYEIRCARCLKLFKKNFNEQLIEVLNSEENCDYLLNEHNKVDIKEAVYTALCLNLSSRHLCSDDCKGLCLVCGANLNEKSCDCVIEDIDPRLLVLKNYFK